MYLNNLENVAYLATFTGRSDNNFCADGECLVYPGTSTELTTKEELKLVIKFPKPTLILGIWWSASHPINTENAIIRRIKKMEFNLPDSNGETITSSAIDSIWKTADLEKRDHIINYFPQPIITDELKLYNFVFKANPFSGQTVVNHKKGHYMRFTMELYGCPEFEVTKGKHLKHH